MKEWIRNTALATSIAITSGACVSVEPNRSPTPTREPSPPTTIFEPTPSHSFPQVSIEPIPTDTIPPQYSPEITSSPEVNNLEKPNIVIVMLDDINPIDGRLWTKERMPTVFKTFVEEGIEFTQVYAETPVCCPARVGFLTGQHTQNHRVLDNEGYINEFDDSESLATELREAGYFNIIVGKYLNQAQKLDDPTLSAFRKQFIFLMENGGYYNTRFQTKEGIEEYGDSPSDYSTDVIARRAVDYLYEAPPDKPIFALITPYTAHGVADYTPIPAPRHINDPRCANIEPWQAPGEGNKPFGLVKICESLLSADELVKAVKDELQRQGRLENTIFIFTADNGMAWGEKSKNNKINPWSTRIPFYLAWPAGRGIESRVEKAALSNIDTAPTLAEAGGAKMGPYPNGQKEPDGISFYDLILDPNANPNEEHKREFILEQTVIGRLLEPAWKALRATETSMLGNYRFIAYSVGTYALYDLSADPYQNNNLAYLPEYEGLIAKFNAILERESKKLEPAP